MGTPDDQAQQQAFWNEFMRTDEAQDALKGDYEEAHRESMRFVEEVVKPEQRRELGEALLSISPDLQRTIAKGAERDRERGAGEVARLLNMAS